MRVNLICVGKIKEKYLSDAIGEYSKRLSRFCKLNIIELKESTFKSQPNAAQIEDIKRAEGEGIASSLKGRSVCMDIDGELVTSERFAEIIREAKDMLGEISVVIGGSYGIEESVKTKFDRRVSFGRVTYPHQLVRVIALEQIYRGFMILENSPYHK